MTIPQVVDGVTDADAAFMNQLVDAANQANAAFNGAGQITTAAITPALEGYGPLSNVATEDTPTKVGQALVNTPAGRGWQDGPISADWYSDLNDALDTAREGVRGVRPVVLSKDVNYDRTGMDSVRLYSGTVLTGESPSASQIVTSTADAVLFEVGDPTTGCDRAVLRDFRLYGDNTADVGIDFRGCTRGLIENVEVQGFTDVSLLVGGDNPEYAYGWNNTFRIMRIAAPTNGAGIRLVGRDDSGAGVSTANRNLFEAIRMVIPNSENAVGVDLQYGDTNQFIGGDYGYQGDKGVVFKLGTGAYANMFAFGGTEAADKVVDSSGARNVFTNWKFSATGEIKIRTGAEFNAFVMCWDGTYVDDDPTNNRTVIIRPDYANVGQMHAFVTSGSYAYSARRPGDTYPRWSVADQGQVRWIDPSTGTAFGGIEREGNSAVKWSDNMYAKIAKHTSLPTANSTRRGSLLRIEGGTGVADGVYICVKDAADAYSWKAVTLV